MSMVLAACGGSDTAAAVLPSYSGATSVTVSDALNTNFTSSVPSGTKNPKMVAYSTADTPDKVKSYFVDNFKKNGWDDKSSDPIVTTQNQQLESSIPGASAVAYTNGNNKASVLIFPGSAASLFQLSGVNATGTLFLVITGQQG
jgi:hypothetical protein